MTDHERLRLLSDGYARALQRYLVQPDESALASAYEMGRKALADGKGVLEMATVHSYALANALNQAHTDAERALMLEALEKFQNEALSPFEMAQRGFRDANLVLRRLNDVLEGQVRRIAYALHDEAAQLLASVHLALADLAVKQPDITKEIASTRTLLNQIEDRLRRLSHELRPPILEDLGLTAALEFLAESVSKRWGIPVAVQVMSDRDLPATVETTLYRISQEALTNVARHAQATRAEVYLVRNGNKVACSVRDDGIGFDAQAIATRPGPRGLGLVEIQERVVALGGVLRVGPRGERGTELTVEIPVEP
jgi:signal transduction histidine kinase